jgi:hypothetical protein
VNQRLIASFVLILVVALAPAAFAGAPYTIDRHQDLVEKVAPPYPTVPGKTLCVCQSNSALRTYVGHLNSYRSLDGGNDSVNIVCTYPYREPAGSLSIGAYCTEFEVIK